MSIKSMLHGDRPSSKSPFSIILEPEVLVQDGVALAVEVDRVLDVRFTDGIGIVTPAPDLIDAVELVPIGSPEKGVPATDEVDIEAGFNKVEDTVLALTKVGNPTPEVRVIFVQNAELLLDERLEKGLNEVVAEWELLDVSVENSSDDCPPGNLECVLDSALERFKGMDKEPSETNAVEVEAVAVEAISVSERVSVDPGLETVTCMLAAGSRDDGLLSALLDVVAVDEDNFYVVELNTLEEGTLRDWTLLVGVASVANVGKVDDDRALPPDVIVEVVSVVGVSTVVLEDAV
ncbi:hypothetical protein Daesc_001581 [Daldinia eschscholtzii]|uniref:Uncharacterized protein n=1 Tax=Daldinia eschscholtzii TaxID=292717 RepID=A0AAX6MUW1_9PEZI